MNGTLQKKINLQPLKNLIKKDPENWKKAMKVGAIQFLTNCNTGQGRSSKKPPIRYGVLRGSSSAFVGSELVQVYSQPISAGAIEAPDPNRNYSAPDYFITWGWNTNYAKKMHEWKGGWGQFTKQDGNAGSKWLEEHIKLDRKLLLNIIKHEYKKITGI